MARQKRDVVQPIELFAATYHYETVEAAQGGWDRLSEDSKAYYHRFAADLNVVRNAVTVTEDEEITQTS